MIIVLFTGSDLQHDHWGTNGLKFLVSSSQTGLRNIKKCKTPYFLNAINYYENFMNRIMKFLFFETILYLN